MRPTGALLDLVRRARRRYFWNIVTAQSVNAICAAMGGLILLLLLGTQILDWPWAVALAAGAIAILGFRLARRVPSAYSVAQEIDSRLGLHDAVSTAYFFSTSERKASPDMRSAQLAAAERLAAGIDVSQAIPFAYPRSVYALAVLGLVASSLFALRYGISHTLDLKKPLPKIVFDAFRNPARELAQLNKKQPKQDRMRDLLKQMGLSLDDNAGKDQQNQNGSPMTAQTLQAQEARKDKAESGKASQKASVEQASDRQEQQGEEQENEADGAGRQGAQDRQSAAQPLDSKQGEQQSAQSQRASNSQESNSLLDKFRDAMSNLLSKLKNQRKSGGTQQASSTSQSERTEMAQQQRPGSGQKGSQGQQAKSDPSASGEESQGDSEGEGTQQAQSSAGKQGGKDGAMQSPKEGQSGIGKENGSKDIKEAEQLAAMGKLSELIGKRSANLTGEMMVEVPSGNQKLRTAYSQQAANHMDLGGEINRDEVPLAFQHYVQQYFEQVRKPGAQAKKQ